jgi:hypothetical protein
MQRPVVSTEFLLRRYSLSWRLMEYALQHEGIRGWLCWNAAIQMAIQRVSTHKYSPEDLALASLDRRNHERRDDLVRKLAQRERPVTAESLQATWLHVVLAWLDAKREDLGEVGPWLDTVYADFDQPLAMAPMIRRASARVIAFGGSWEERRDSVWRHFLDEQRPAEARMATCESTESDASKSIRNPKRLISR